MSIDFTMVMKQVPENCRSRNVSAQQNGRDWFDWLQDWRTFPLSFRRFLFDCADAWLALRLAGAAYRLSPPQSVMRLSSDCS